MNELFHLDAMRQSNESTRLSRRTETEDAAAIRRYVEAPTTDFTYSPGAGDKFDDGHDLSRSLDASSDIEKSMQTASSSSAVSVARDCDESDDLLSDYTSETTFFDAEVSPSVAGRKQF